MTEDFYATYLQEGRARAREATVLRRRNRIILAKRLGWPDDALAACTDLERRHRGFVVAWMRENRYPGFERPAGFYAWVAGHDPLRNGVRRREWFGVTAEDLAAELRTAPRPARR